MKINKSKKPRFFGHPEVFGDGDSWAYLGDTPEAIKNAFDMAFSAAKIGDVVWNDVAEDTLIKVIMMTDAEIKKLPEM
jgi:hypothetical protein